MAMHQRACLKGLTEWKRAFRKIKYQPSRVAAVSQLVKFAAEQAEAVGQIQAAPPTAELEHRYGSSKYLKKNDAPGTVDFSGVIEGRNLSAPAATGDGNPAVIVPAPEPGPVPPVFPLEAEILVYGFTPNLRLLAGELPDKRRVSVWKGPRNWRLPSKVPCKLDPLSSAGNPIYMPA